MSKKFRKLETGEKIKKGDYLKTQIVEDEWKKILSGDWMIGDKVGNVKGFLTKEPFEFKRKVKKYEKLKFETQGREAITPCPYNQKTKIIKNGVRVLKSIGSISCENCDFSKIINVDKKFVKCSYKHVKNL